jgi:trigger factor
MSLKSINKIETNKVEIEITVDAEKFKAAVDKAFKKNSVKMNVPGFRQGKAPRPFIEKLYGEGVFYEDAVNSIYPEEYEEAVKESGIEAIDRAEIEVVSVGKEGLVFKAKVTVKPEVEIGEYKGLVATKKITLVSDEEVMDELKRLQDRNSRVISIEDRVAQNEDITIIDFDGYVDGVAFKGGKAEKHELVLGSNSFIPGFEDQIIGHAIGDEFDVTVKFPDDYQAEELAGKDATFKTILHEIKTKELQELDDEFAKDVSEFDTLEDLKVSIKSKKFDANKTKAEDELENSLIDLVIDSMKVEIPEIMITRAVDNMVSDFDYRLQSQGMNLESYIQYTGMDMEAFRQNFHEQAVRQVKARLALEKIASLEDFEISEEEKENEYKKIAERYNVSVDKVKASFDDKYISEDIKCNKSIDLVKSTAVVAVVEEEAHAASTEANEPDVLNENADSEVSADSAETEEPVISETEQKPEKSKKARKSAKTE